MKIGIPRSSLYPEITSQAEQILKRLGIDVILSPISNKQIYAQALQISDSEFCMPLKLLLSHINELKNKSDYILIPAQIGDSNEYYCSMSVSVSDICRNIFSGIRILEIDGSLTSYINLSKIINKSASEITQAFNLSIKHETPTINIDKAKKTIVLVARPYVLNDSLLNKDIKKLLHNFNVNIITSEQITNDHLHKITKSHWHHTNKQISAILDAYDNPNVHGVIYVTPFNCGPDYLIEEFTRKFKTKPFLRLNLDEHSADAGIMTRLEAFMEII